MTPAQFLALQARRQHLLAMRALARGRPEEQARYTERLDELDQITAMIQEARE